MYFLPHISPEYRSWVYAYHFNLLPPKEERENKELEDDAVDIQTLGFTTRELRYGNAHKGLVIPGLRRKLRNFKLVPITRVLEYRDQSAIGAFSSIFEIQHMMTLSTAITDVVVNMKFMGGQAQDLILPRLNFLAAIAADFRVIKRGYDGVLGFSPAVTGSVANHIHSKPPILSLTFVCVHTATLAKLLP